MWLRQVLFAYKSSLQNENFHGADVREVEVWPGKKVSTRDLRELDLESLGRKAAGGSDALY